MVTRWTTYWRILSILAGLCQLGACQDDPVTNQLAEYAETHSKKMPLTAEGGQPEEDTLVSQTCGKDGPMTMDGIFLRNLARFDRERIPERVLFARGSGAFGYFEVTNDITKYTKADLFNKVGKKTPIAVRFSLANGERGTPETVRDTRGMAIKHYTKEGIWDFLGSNFPVFFFRDPMVMPHLTHALRRNPKTNIKDSVALLDFLTSLPETIHNVLFLFGDRGIPDGYRHMNGYGINTYVLWNDKNEEFYARFIYKTDQGIKNLNSEKALKLTATDPDYFTRDLYDAIEKKEYPSWTFYMQVMKKEDASKCAFNIFDPTKVWLHKDYQLVPIGKIVLNENPVNYFAEVEQLAFNPSNSVPGIGFMRGRLEQGVTFVYPDAQLHRLGPNYQQIPVNSPKDGLKVRNYIRDGQGVHCNKGDQPNYYPNSFKGPYPVSCAAVPEYNVSGTVKRWSLSDDDNYSQPRAYWNKVLKDDEKERIVEEIVQLAKSAPVTVKEKVVAYFEGLAESLGQEFAQKLEVEPKTLASKCDEN